MEQIHCDQNSSQFFIIQKMENIFLSEPNRNNGYREINLQNDKWIPFNRREKISPIRIFAICANQITTNFIWIPLGVLTKPYCMKLGLSHYGSTLVLMIGNIIGFIVPPLVASISDTTTFRYGRRRIYLIIGEILVLIGFIFICFCHEISLKLKNSSIFNFVIGQTFTYLGGNIANGPGRAMCSDVVPPRQQVLVSNICALDGAIVGIISNSIGAFKLYKYTKLSNETFVLLVSCFIGLISLIISVIFTPEERLVKKQLKRNPIQQVIDSFYLIDDELLKILIAFFFFQVGTTEFAIQSSNYVAMYIFGGVPNKDDGVYDMGISFAQLLSLLQTIFQLLYSFFNTKIVNNCGFKLTWSIATSFLFLSNLLFFFISNKYLLIFPYLFFGISCVIGFSLPYAYISLITPTEQLAGRMTLVILFGNIGGILVMFVLTLYIGSFKLFLDNPGRLVGVSTVFAAISFLIGRKCYKEPNLLEL